MAVAILTVRIRRLGRVYRLEPWRAASLAIGEAVHLRPDDLCGVRVELDCAGRSSRANIYMGPM